MNTTSKTKLSNILRKFNLIYGADYMRFYILNFRNSKLNKQFKKQFPEVVLPPDYLMYESFQINYEKYYKGGISTAEWIFDYIKKFKNLENLNILDWGCGPARVIRHLPDLLDNSNVFYGTDYNEKSISWCKSNLLGINFNLNKISPPLSYESNKFDVIYGISIFTHLSKELHFQWIDELYRVLKTNGVLFVTTQGRNFTHKLNQKEKIEFNKGNIVIRGNVKDGHRTYSAFHPKKFMLELFKDFEIFRTY